MKKTLCLLSFLAIGDPDSVSKKNNQSSNSTLQMDQRIESSESTKNNELFSKMMSTYSTERNGSRVLSLKEDNASRWILSLDGQAFVLFYTLHEDDSKTVYMRTSVPQPQPISAEGVKGVKQMSSRTLVEWDNVCKQTCLSQELCIDSLQQGATAFREQVDAFVLIAKKLLEGEENIARLRCSIAGTGTMKSTRRGQMAKMLDFNQSMQQLTFSTSR